MNLTPESRIRQHVKERFTTLAAERHRSVQDALAGLQKALQEHATVAQSAAGIPDDQVEQFAAGIEGLADEALRNAVSQARDQAAAAAHEELTRTRTQLQQELDTARADFEKRQAMLESRLEKSQRDISTISQQRDEHAASLHQTASRLEEETQRRLTLEKQLDVAFNEVARTRSQLEQELEEARSEFDERHARLQSRLAEADRDVATTRQDRDELAANLHQTRARIEAVEEAGAKAMLDSQLAAARLEEETQRRVAVEKQLDASRQELVLARAEADARRLEAQVAARRVTTTAESTAPNTDARDIITWVKRGVDALSGDPREQLLATIVEQLKCEFQTVGVFAAGQDGFRLWNTHPVESKLLPSHVGALDGGSLLSRAVSDQAAARVEASPGVETRGLTEQPMAHAIAAPIIVQQRVLAVVYAENPPDRRTLGPQLLVAAEMLVDCLNRRLNQTNSPSSAEQLTPDVPAAAAHEPPAAAETVPVPTPPEGVAPAFAVSRQAERLRITGAVQLLVDGVSSALVDVSTLGAQVVSPATMKPNRIVRVLLPSGSGAFTCTGRIMWAQLEPPKPDTPPQYRSGIQFIDIHPMAIESFISRHRPRKTSPSTDAAQLLS
jgi:hypothetical protein